MTAAASKVAALSYIKVSRPRENVAQITISRPEKRNALDQSGWSDLGKAFRELANDRSVRAVILAGTDGSFCAGDDIMAFRAVQADPLARQVYWDSIMEAYAAVSAIPVPVIAAVDGPCYGGGCTLALRCDFRIVGSNASFAIPPAKLGLVYPADGTALLVTAVGVSTAKYMLYSGNRLDAAQAVESGLAFGLGTDTSDVIGSALSLAEEFTGNAPLAIEASKIACDAIAIGQLTAVQGKIRALSERADRSNDYKEGAAAFAAKRPPVFTGT
ncbi:enoyl-CoA hydratase/isomerase family protein [Agrobacterium sp. BA1120]|uniref:enoyl-CoA hydratase/isomerase family protein n=1 Tax=Agrobacterium sp. BA1120 TaxID=3228927 RepID=UPI003369F446